MADLNELLKKLNSDEKLKKTFNRSGVYTDEPIIIPASRMNGYTPERITQMIRMAKTGEMRYYHSYRVFYLQGKAMEDFTDNYEYTGTFTCYYPTYTSMTITQLRGYFTWRTAVRRGEYPEVSLSFIFVYIYELICGIGVSSAEKGFDALVDISEKYSTVYPVLRHFIKKWLEDYVVYYGLGSEYADRVFDNIFDENALILTAPDEHTDAEIISAIKLISSYGVERSPFYKSFPEDMDRVLAGVYRRMCIHHLKKSKHSYPEMLFGEFREYEYELFRNAVFYDNRKYEDYQYSVSPARSFSCVNGRWECRSFFSTAGCRQKLGDLCKTVDSVMRERYGSCRPIMKNIDTKYVLAIINEEIDALLAEKKKAEESKVTIDVTKLGGIRSAADITRDRLMTESEMEETVSAVIDPQFCQEEESLSESGKHPADDCAQDAVPCGLSEAEYEYMKVMLYGGDKAAAVKKSGVPLSVLIDNINEKMFDSFGDTVLDFYADEPEFIEDYIEELKGMIKP